MAERPITLYDLKEGEQGVILRVGGSGAFRKRITEMGFVRGKIVRVVRKAPLRDPVEYSIMGYEVSLRENEARLVEVKPLNSADNAGLDDKQKPRFSLVDEQIRKTGRSVKNKVIDVALVGNPNSGKTTLFNYASGSHQHVGNYSGVTVDTRQAKCYYKQYTINLIDLPGTYSLTAYSPEEVYVRKYILEHQPDLVLNVVDASNLERNLYLTTQLIDMNLKVVMALNMVDELEAKGDIFNYTHFAMMTGIPIVPTVGRKGEGINELLQQIVDVYEDREPIVRHVHLDYGIELEEAIGELQSLISANKGFADSRASRFFAIKLLEKDQHAFETLRKLANFTKIRERSEFHIKRIETFFTEDAETLITDVRYGFISGALKETYIPNRFKRNQKTDTEIIDTFITHKIFGFPIFLFFLWIMFQATFRLGDYPQHWIELLVSWVSNLAGTLLPTGIVRDLLVDGIIRGVGGVIVFMPNILILFLFISFMEDSGYMARAAFIMDRLMHKIGLHGKSFIPLIMGFGCNVPAIMATRTLQSRNERLLTMLINPFMSCSARLPVYILIIAAFFPGQEVTILFLVYLIGIIAAVGFAVLFKKTLFRGADAPFVMELPPYRLPTMKSTLRHMWMKGSQYLRKMGGVILIASLIIWALGYFPRNNPLRDSLDREIVETEVYYNHLIASSGPEKSERLNHAKDSVLTGLYQEKSRILQENSFIGMLGRAIEPVIRPLGFDWRMGVSLLAGVSAKEVVISTMSVLYSDGEPAGSRKETLTSRLRNAKFDNGEKSGYKIFNKASAFAFLMFILLYFPCVAVIAAVRRESGSWKWALFLVVYTTLTAWIVAFAAYHIGLFFI